MILIALDPAIADRHQCLATVRGPRSSRHGLHQAFRVLAERLFDESVNEPENEQGGDDFQPVVWHLPVCAMLREK